MAARPSVHVGNAGATPMTLTVTIDSIQETFEIQAGGALDIPIPDDDWTALQAAQTAIVDAASAYAAAPATAADHAAASAALVSEQLATVPVPRSDVASILQTLLGEASAGIPFFEEYALDPSMTAQQWTNFQALDQTTKDRLLYDTVRTLAATLRYLTGLLPT